MSNSPQQPPAGWYPDPAGTDSERYWDGVAWSQSTRDKPRPMPAPSAPPTGGPYQQYQSYGEPTAGYGGYSGYATSSDPVGGRPLAGFWWRVLGYIIDAILVGIVGSIINNVTGLQARIDRATDGYLTEILIWSDSPSAAFPMPSEELTSLSVNSSMITLAIWMLYRVVMYGTMSATAGQLALGMRVVRADQPVGTKLTWAQAAVRGIASAVLWQFIGFINALVAAFTRQKQTLGDLIAKTHVVKIR